MPCPKGYKRSVETCAKISAAKRGKKRAPFSAEWLRRMSEAHIGRSRSAKDRDETASASLSCRRAIQRLMLAFRKPISLDFVAKGGSERVEFLLGFAHEPSPLEALIQKEEWEQERKYWLWRENRKHSIEHLFA